jgi:DNA-binding Lrp family transcriptional regulator
LLVGVVFHHAGKLDLQAARHDDAVSTFQQIRNPAFARLATDYQLKVVVKDMDAFQELLLNRITRILGVSGVHSSFVLCRVVDKTALPI